jgi:N-acetylneuraminic acid mutarotase
MPISLKLFANKKAALALILISVTALLMVAIKPVWASGDSWTSKAPMREARGGLGVAVVSGKIYAIGGSTEGIQLTNTQGIMGTNEEYDPATDTWTYKASMPTPRVVFAIAACQNKIYCIGGQTNGTATGANEVYDPATDTWETKAAMPTPRSFLTANVVGDKIYLVGGYPNETLNEVYDPATDSWTTKAAIPTGATSYASTVVGNKIYVIGGYSEHPIFFSNVNQIYDPANDRWSQGSLSPLRVWAGAAGATTGVLAPKRIYVIGVPGYIYTGPPPQCYTQVYDPESNRWTVGANITTNRFYFGVAVVNDKLYAIGGVTYSLFGFVGPSAVNEQYTPSLYGTQLQPELVYAAAGAVAITIIAVTAVVLKKRHKQDKTSIS